MLKFLLIVLCIFYLARLFFRATIGNYVRNTRLEYEEKLREAERRASQSGSVHIEKTTSQQTKKYSKDEGEYIDYEEVK